MKVVMAKAKKKPVVKKVIWRMSNNAPLGEYVHPGESGGPNSESPVAPKPDPKSSWKLSSLELSDGLQVSEQPIDTLPDELWDEFFKR
jgi:hypothetical protein